MTTRLTDAYIRKLTEKRDAGEIQPGEKIFDSLCPGLFALVGKTKISYAYEYNVCRKRQKITFGDAGFLTISEARRLCLEAKVEAAKLRRERHFERIRALSRGKLTEYKAKAEAEVLTFGAVVEKYLAKKEKEIAPGTFINKKRVAALCCGKFQGEKINELTKADLISFCNAQKNTIIKNTFLFLREVFTFAAASGFVALSPLSADDNKALNKGEKRGHIVSPETLPAYAAKLSEAFEVLGADYTKVKRHQKEYQKYLLLLQLLPCRSNELAEAQWKDVNFERQEIKIHQTKTGKENVLPLNALSMALLRSTKTYKDRRGKIFAFNKISVKNKINKVKGFSLHSIRSFFETQLLNLDKPKQDCEAVLGHLTDQYKGAYDRAQNIEKKRRLLDFWTEYLCRRPEIQTLFAAALESLKDSANYPREYLHEFTEDPPPAHVVKIERWIENTAANAETLINQSKN